MPGTDLLRRSGPELAWGAFAALNIVAMVVFPHQATIPFHFVWISLMMVYGWRLWSPRATCLVLGGVSLATGLAIFPHTMAENNWVEITEVPLMAAIFGVMVIYARRRQTSLEAERRGAEKQREFVRDASHQLRTPITVARGHAELVAMDLADSTHGEDLAIVLDELETLGRLSQNLLTLDGALRACEADPDPIDVEYLLQRARRRWSATASRRWRVGVPTGTTVTGNAERLAAALDALIENALVATGDGDEIALLGRSDATGVIIEVSDSGPGIPPEQEARIFDRFYRPDGSPPGGSGLGLSIVQAIAEMHGGGVSVGPSANGGATFRVRLPTPA